jgi:hypothetical protein
MRNRTRGFGALETDPWPSAREEIGSSLCSARPRDRSLAFPRQTRAGATRLVTG